MTWYNIPRIFATFSVEQEICTMNNTTTDVATKYVSCTPHRRKAKFHISWDDFDEITLDIYNSGALRAFEVETNRRIGWLRKKHGIPATHLPNADDLWIAMPYRAVQELTLKRVGHSVCQRIFAEEAVEDTPPSLILLRFIQRRFIAKRTSRVVKDIPATVYIEKDDNGDTVEFIVTDEAGNYTGIDGKEYSAPLQGFGLIERQYLYCIEAIRAAIADLDRLEPPAPSPRWEPMIEHREPQQQQKSIAGTRETTKSTRSDDDAVTNGKPVLDAQTGTSRFKSEVAMSFALENNIASSDVSSGIPDNSPNGQKITLPANQHGKQYRDTIDLAALRVAPMTPETLIGLTSCILDVPAKPEESDEEALHQWVIDWWEPAQRLYAATISLSEVRAWERIDLTTRYMATPGSPSWWQRGPEPGKDWRKTKAPVTLRNVADRYVFEYDDFQRNKNIWYPSATTPYDGPPLFMDGDESYEGTVQLVGSVAVTEVPMQVLESVDGPHSAALDQVQPMGNEAQGRDEEQRTAPTTGELAGQYDREPTTDKVVVVPAPPVAEPARLPGMSQGIAEHLSKRIRQRCPGIELKWTPVTEDGERVVVGIEYAKGAWLYFRGLSEWLRPTPEVAEQIEEAIAFHAGMGSDVAAKLIERIKKCYPGIGVGWRYTSHGNGRVIVGIECGPEDWLDFNDPSEWGKRTKETQGRIEQALLYAASSEGGGSSPPEQEQGESEGNIDEQGLDLPGRGGRGNSALFRGARGDEQRGHQDLEEASEAPLPRDVSLVGIESRRGDDSRGGVQTTVRDGGP
jgi:hypothetical protein